MRSVFLSLWLGCVLGLGCFSTVASESQTTMVATTSAAGAESIEPEQTEFIDTIDIGAEGNWLAKRKWYEKAQVIYERISDLIDEVMNLRMPFFVKRTDLDKTVLDPFYVAIGLDQGELLEAVNALITKMNQERELQGALDKHELEVLDKLQEEKATVEQLQKDVDEVLQIDHDIDDALGELSKQVDRCRAWQREAWNNLKAIAAELSDKKAEELCYAMESQEANVKAILAWIQGDFTVYFNERVKKAEEQTVRIKDAVAQLKTKGIDLKEQVLRIDEQSEKERLEAATEKAEKEALAEAKEKAKERLGFFGRVFAAIKSVFMHIWDFIVYCVKGIYTWVARILGFTEAEPEDEEEEESSSVVEPTASEASQAQTGTEVVESSSHQMPVTESSESPSMVEDHTMPDVATHDSSASQEAAEPEPIMNIDTAGASAL